MVPQTDDFYLTPPGTGTERQLVLCKEFAHAVFNTTLDGFWIVDCHGRVTNANAAYCRMTGYTPEELQRTPINDIDVVETTEQTINRMGRIRLNGAEIFETRHRRKDGSSFPVEISVTYLDVDGGCYIGFCRDITNRKHAEQCLQSAHDAARAGESLFRRVFTDTLVPFALIDTSTKSITVNRRFTQLYGYSDADITDVDTWWRLCYPDEEYRAEARARWTSHRRVAESNGTAIEADEYRIVDREGRERYVEISAAVIDEFLLISVIDQSERRSADMEVRRQLAEKELLLKEVHHRTKNNIATIEALLALQASSAADAYIESSLNDAVSRVQGMRVLYETLLTSPGYSQLSTATYFDNLIRAVGAIFPSGAGLTVDTRIDHFELHSKKMIPLGIILNELLTNVFKYAFVGRTSGSVTVRLQRDGEVVRLVVADDGVGADQGKAGFGTMIVNMLVEQLDATYHVDTANGTTSTIEFVG